MDDEAAGTALKKFTYGLYLLTATGDDDYAVGTVNWLSQASFKPPLVMVGVKKDSTVFEYITDGAHFAINILNDEQESMAAAFFGPSSVEGDEINGYRFREGESGAPVFDAIEAHVECREVGRVDEGDHVVVVGEVIEASVENPELDPLVMWDTEWVYGGVR